MSLDEDTLRALFDRSQKANPDKMQFSEEESARFQKSFEDPEFRKLFADYMDELQDPKNREETEAYISQLEGEQKVPEGKELIRPEPAFVAKSFKIIKKDNNDKEKVFLNIVKSDKISVPSKTTTPKGTCWSVPYSLGPPHMEKDKNGSNAPCFDCCFHPDAIALGVQHKEFKDLLVTTAMEGVEKLYQQQGQDVTINREFHIVKGLSYKQGPVPTMMIAVAAKENWKDKDGKVPIKDTTKKAATARTVPALAAAAPAKASDPSGMDFPAELEAPDVADKPKAVAAPAIKKGFLTNSKGAIYGDKLTTLRKKTPAGEEVGRAPGASKGISLVDQPASGGLNNLNIPSGSTAAKSGKAGSSGNGLIQEVKKGDKPAPMAAAATTTAKAPAPTAVGGLTAVSTTKRTPAPVPAGAALASTPLSPSGRREVAVTSPSGSEVLDSESPSPEPEHQLEGGLERPKYTVTERGVVSMGDFENLNTAARSNRPSELVFRVELPKIVKASQIVLDIAERQLNLSYPDVYSLNVRLPYPVFDTKGTAKYDKATKSLTVTLPVRPPPAAPVGISSSPVKQAGPVSTISSQDGSSTEAAEEQVDGGKRSTPAKKTSSVGHGRWVESSPADKATADSTGGDAPEKALSLHEEIKRQAEIALREAQAAAAAAKAAIPAVSAPVAKAVIPAATCVAAAAVAPALTTGDFIPSTSFAGKKAGYVFKKGDQGVGYYVDAKTASKTLVSPAATAAETEVPVPVPAAVQHVPFPFECRQTKPALALIVEVPRIHKESLRVEFESHSLRVSFRALADVPVDGTAATTSSVGAVLYGSVLQLREGDCPGGLDVSLCRFDAQKQNLAIVLTKALPQFWHSSAEKREVAAVAAGESKSGDVTSDETRSLFTVVPFTGQVARTSPASPGSLPPPPATVQKQAAPASAANAEAEKALKSLESTIQAMQFSSSDALFELD